MNAMEQAVSKDTSSVTSKNSSMGSSSKRRKSSRTPSQQLPVIAEHDYRDADEPTIAQHDDYRDAEETTFDAGNNHSNRVMTDSFMALYADGEETTIMDEEPSDSRATSRAGPNHSMSKQVVVWGV